MNQVGSDTDSASGVGASSARILVCDDDPDQLELVRQVLLADGFSVVTANGGARALDLLRTEAFALVVTDMKMPDFGGLDLLRAARSENVPLGIIAMSGYPDLDAAVEAMKHGADDFLVKPFEIEALQRAVRRILKRRALADELELLRQNLRNNYSFHTMISKSPKMRRAFDRIAQVAPFDSAVLIQGETGTGKELVARAIHAASRRRSGPFRALNCAVLPGALLETELFGHERGAFTGAERQKLGRFEDADGGTLLLDEIGDMSPAMQAKLLRVLNDGTFERVGGNRPVKVDVRIVAASHKRLDHEVEAGRFRKDLLYRLDKIRIELPPLRERVEDIPLLAMHFLEKLRAKSNPPVTEIDPLAMQALLEHRWAGNVRELENAIRAAVALTDGPCIRRSDLPASVAPRCGETVSENGPIDTSRSLPALTSDLIAHVERDYLSQVLTRFRGNVARSALHSGLSRRSVTQKLVKYGLDRDLFRPRPRSRTRARDERPE